MLPSVSRISYGGKVRPHKELFLIQSDMVGLFVCLFYPFSFCLNLHIELRNNPSFLPEFIELEESIGGPPVMHCMKEL